MAALFIMPSCNNKLERKNITLTKFKLIKGERIEELEVIDRELTPEEKSTLHTLIKTGGHKWYIDINGDVYFESFDEGDMMLTFWLYSGDMYAILHKNKKAP